MKSEFESWPLNFEKAVLDSSLNCPVTLLSPRTFYQRYLECLRLSQTSVEARTMIFLPGNYTDPIARELTAASLRGVDVFMGVDLISGKYLDRAGSKIAWFGSKLVQPVRKMLIPNVVRQEEAYQIANREFADSLQEAGIDWVWLNTSNSLREYLPFFGANHIKAFVIDKKVGWGFAGMGNLYDGGFESFDYMPETKHPDLIEALSEVIRRVDKPAEDRQTQIIPGFTLLVDAGRRGQSVTYKQAIEMVDDEKTAVRLVSQLLPSGRLLDAMMYQSAHGTQVHIYTSDKNDSVFTSFPFNLSCRGLREKILKSEIILHEAPPDLHVHGKGIYTEGRQEALFTSNNLNWAGVRAGTEENGLYTTNTQAVLQMENFFKCFPEEV